ncbi:MAG: hybrid sensor histidine kinase/response regulator, partial [Myxococcales bacterium]|nr:hybrid sensor histidine kinase/response regulator [Myxococcales bacterium]
MNDNERPAIDLGEFLTVLSHQLRNPVQAISSNAWLLKSRASDEKILRPAQAIERQVARLSKVLDDVLDMVRVTRNAALETAPVSLQQVVAAGVVVTQESMDTHRREINVDMPEAPILVNADAKRLAQAIGNLLHNAVKFSPQQGQIEVRVKRSGDTATVSVKDQGAGIAAEDLARVFEPFAHGKSRSHHSEVELGIGLHIARQLVRAHGGGIEAYSAGLGKGAEFLVRLPVATGATLNAPSRDTQGEDNDRLSVLVVDDSRDAADGLTEVLLAHGHDARAAYGGQQAIDVGTQEFFDVALVDIGMPGIDGLEVARQISRSQTGSRTLLVALTGWGANEDRERSKQAGFAYHLTKPVDIDTLG